MVEIDPLERYRSYLEVLDRYAPGMNEDEYVELFGLGESLDLLYARDELAATVLTPDGQGELRRLDDLLVKHRRAVLAPIQPPDGTPRSHWWWYLHEGIHVRDQAASAARGE